LSPALPWRLPPRSHGEPSPTPYGWSWAHPCRGSRIRFQPFSNAMGYAASPFPQPGPRRVRRPGAATLSLFRRTTAVVRRAHFTEARRNKTIWAGVRAARVERSIVIERARDPITRLGMQIPSFTYPDVPTEVVSSSRANLGIGSAWNEDEHRGYGRDSHRSESGWRPCRSARPCSPSRPLPSTVVISGFTRRSTFPGRSKRTVLPLSWSPAAGSGERSHWSHATPTPATSSVTVQRLGTSSTS
jgi:hypothetical protein